MIKKSGILFRLIIIKLRQILIPMSVSTLVSSILLLVGTVLLYQQTGTHPFIMILGGLNPSNSIDLLKTSIYLLVIFPPILSTTLLYKNVNESNVLLRTQSISIWWNSIIISCIIVCLLYILWLFVLVRGIECIANVESFNIHELMAATFLLIFSFIVFIVIINTAGLLVTKNEKYAVAVTMILILSAFIPIGSESSIMCFMPGSWGMLLRTRLLYGEGINEYLAVILNISATIITTILGKYFYKKEM